MRANDTIIPDEEAAAGYDQQAIATHWHAPEVVFGLAYEYVQPGETLLDLGIGSGLSSMPFHKAGLKVSGLDGSAEVLRVCAQKSFALDLRQHDLRDLPFPYPSASFDHVLCVAVLNSFADLGPLFAEAARIVRPGGTFAFTLEEQHPGEEDRYQINRVEVSDLPEADSAVTLYRHREAAAAAWLDQAGFALLKTQEFVAFHYPAEERNVFFKAYVAQRRK